MAEKELRLKVGELTAREEAGRGVVRIDAKLLKELGIREGDVVEVEGKRKTAALAFRSYPADVGLNIIRMDGITRRNAETGVGEFVKIRAAETKEARRITLAPAEKGIIVHISPNLIKQNIFTRPMVEGDLIVPSPVVSREGRGFFEEILGFDVEEMFFPTIAGETRFIVTRTEPSGIVRVGDITQVEILRELPEALKARERIPAVTYEDVGGIKPIVTKIREMIELPLRHPELFERLGVEAPKGVLLHGPPGTGKTLLAKAVANESGANFISISGPEIFSKWYGQSLPGSELVWIVDNGMVKRVPIKDVVESGRKGLKTICFNEEGKVDYGDIVDFIKHKNGSKILEIRTASGRRIKVTDYHSLFTLNGSKIEAIKTSDLVAGKSFIAIPRKIPWPEKAVEEIDLLDELKENDYGIKVMGVGQYIREAIRKVGHGRAAEILGYGSKYLYDVINKNIRIPVSKFLTLMREAEIELDKENIRICTKGKSLPAKLKLNKEFLTFLGLWVAEGSYTNKLEPRLSLNENEIKEVKELCEKLFGRVTVYQKENSKGSEIHINSSILGKILRYVLDLEGGARKKKVPGFVFNLNAERLSAFLRGYFSGDGSIYLNQHGVPEVEASTESERLVDELLHLLLYFNIVAKMYERKDERRIQKRVVLTGAENLLRFKTIGFLDFGKNALITNYLLNIGWERSEQILITPPIRQMLNIIPSARQWTNSATIGRNILSQFANRETAVKFGIDDSLMRDIINLVSNDIYWDRVEEIKEAKEEEYVYDLSVSPKENFLAGFGGIFAHNTEENLRKIFEEAEKTAPSIIFIDEIDAIAPKREEVTGEVERRTVSQLLACMDGLKKRGKVIVIAATNRPHSLDPALRRAGRFDREIEFPVPDKKGRLEILKIHTRNMPLAKDFNLEVLADITHGYVGADIWALCKEAAMSALRRILPEIKWKEEEELPREVLEKLVVTRKDFENAFKMVEPSAMREVLIEIPKVKWEDIGGLEDVKQQLKEMVEWPLKYPESFKRLGIQPPRGILLYGPPGCGKTLLAQAAANEAGVNFISVKGPEVYSLWVGESERRIRELFRRARQVAPSIIFLDEVDALAPRRGIYTGTRVTETVVSQLLTELSGIEELRGVVVMAASNRPDLIDTALLRPGRIDRHVLVPAPDTKSRLKIIEVHTKKQPLAKNVDLKELVKTTEGFSGADIEAVCREAAMNAMREDIKAKEVKMKHFKQALEKIKPSLTKEIIEYYEQFRERQKKAVKEEAPPYIG